MDYIPHVSRYIPTYTYIYLYINTYTCIYLHIHAHTCTYMLNLGAPEHPKYASDFGARGCVLHNAVGRTNDPSLSLPGRSWPILRPWQHGTQQKIVGEGASLTPSPAINKSPISAHTIVSCTMEMAGRSGKVMACPEHPG